VNASSDHIDQLIASYLSGEATAEEMTLVENWTNESEDNRRYFEQVKVIFERAAAVTAIETFSTDEAWIRVREKLDRKEKTRRLSTPTRYPYYRIAAGILLLIAAGIFTYRYFAESNDHSSRVLSENHVAADTLPDGSDVFLNRHTSIVYTFDRKNNTHTAQLTGEAYFNINHDSEKSFVVEADGTFIKDIGTSFNVKAYPGSRTIEVFVEEGEVMFYTRDNPGVYLKANGRGIYNKDTGKFAVAEPEPNVTAYKTRFFNFSNSSLDRVVETLNEVYSTKLRIDDRLNECRLTVSFNDENIEEIANVIAETLGLTISNDGSVITLEGSGCAEHQPQ
jgi:ferric-dicitrate binding protein FerR (iron transport regulator)